MQSEIYAGKLELNGFYWVVGGACAGVAGPFRSGRVVRGFGRGRVAALRGRWLADAFTGLLYASHRLACSFLVWHS